MKGLHGATYNMARLIQLIGDLLNSPTSDLARDHSKLSAADKKSRYQMAIVLSELRRAARESAEGQTNADSTAAASAAAEPVGYDRDHLMFTSLPTWIAREEAKEVAAAAAAEAAPADEGPDEGPVSPIRRSFRIHAASPVNVTVAARAMALHAKIVPS